MLYPYTKKLKEFKERELLLKKSMEVKEKAKLSNLEEYYRLQERIKLMESPHYNPNIKYVSSKSARNKRRKLRRAAKRHEELMLLNNPGIKGH